MRTSSKWKEALAVLAWWAVVGAHCTVAQRYPSASELLQELQSERTTDHARDELLKLGDSNPEVRSYLAIHLPQLIASGPTSSDCPGNSCGPWMNAVEIAGNLKIDEAAPALTKWINWRNPGAPVGLSLEARLVFYPPARALIKIGDPAIPAVQDALQRGSSGERSRALRILCIIDSPHAQAVLRDELQHEPDPNLHAMIKKALGAK